ncbi:MAG TPA: cytidine deaminase [Polyangiaceae bacterium]
MTAKKGDLEQALAAARLARSRAYAPYSRYAVGAGVLTRSGRVYSGCNVENATFGATLCAERSAIAAMVAAGDRDPVACVVVTGGPRPGSPCGICRQVLSEFARDMNLLLVAEEGSGSSGKIVARKTARLAALLPQAFRLVRGR